MKTVWKAAFVATLPVLTGYLVLGMGFGMLMNAAGFGVWPTVAMSVFIYAGSMQYAAVGLLTGGVSLVTVAMTTLAVNARHVFYGISMLDRYKYAGICKPYLIFSLTDETYSLLCGELPHIPEHHRTRYQLLVSLLDHAYWVVGSLMGAVLGTLVAFDSEGIEFALTALFITVFLEQWLTSRSHASAIVGVAVSVGCLAVFGSETFLIPSMFIMALCLALYPDKANKEGEVHE